MQHTQTTANTIQLLAKLAADATLNNADLAEQLQALNLTAEQQHAFIQGDTQTLEQLLRIDSIVCNNIKKDVPDDDEDDAPAESPDKETEIRQAI
ncbi:hypothetical protein AADZ86_12040 [Colwelliaceae bacterium BS250]